MNSKKSIGFTITAVTAALLVACGGSGGGTSSNTIGGTTTTATKTLQGTAAIGAAFEGATITVTDKTGAVVGTSSAVGADGAFSITISANAVAPFVLTASRTTADGAVETLVSVVPTGTGTTSTATVNVSQVTNLIASRLSTSGDPSQLAAELAAGTSTINATTVAAKVSEVQTILAPILAAAGASSTDPLTGTFAVGGAGYDHFLDSIKVTITPATASSTNIEVGVKQQTADDAAPTVVGFTSQTVAASVPVLPAITASSLVPSGTAALISAHLAQLTSCYALPTTTRVNRTVTGGLATGTAANVVAPACTSAFFGDAPASFKSNGATVGRDASNNGAFASLFRDGATGVVFSQGSYEFTRNNGDIVAGYKSRDTLGNETFDTFVLRLDTADGKLKQIGNQYAYGGGVNPYQQLREFVMQPAQSYYSTGYNISVPNIPGITYVDVTAPNGNHITLIPGSDGMVLPKRGSASPLVAGGSNYVRIRSEYATSTGAPTAHPSTLETEGLFFVGTDYTEDQVAAIPNHGVWTISYYSGGTNNATGGTLQATQFYKTRTRANTIAELRKQGLANLSAASVADMVSNYRANGGLTNSYAVLSATSTLAPSWEVPAGALPPTQIKLFGTALYYDYTTNTTKTGGASFVSTTNAASYANGRTSFNDGKTVGSLLRTASIGCANGTIDANNMGERHCASPAGYLASTRQQGLHLRATDASGREYVHFYAPYTLQ